MKPIDLFSKIYDMPMPVRTRLMSLGIPLIIPIASGLGIRLRALDDTHSESTMPFSRRSRNHVGSIYLGTLVVHAEL
ncbi:MAG TPA: hypothetical protein VGO62_06700, partial [Myxococcota bacterium]